MSHKNLRWGKAATAEVSVEEVRETAKKKPDRHRKYTSCASSEALEQRMSPQAALDEAVEEWRAHDKVLEAVVAERESLRNKLKERDAALQAQISVTQEKVVLITALEAEQERLQMKDLVFVLLVNTWFTWLRLVGACSRVSRKVRDSASNGSREGTAAERRIQKGRFTATASS